MYSIQAKKGPVLHRAADLLAGIDLELFLFPVGTGFENFYASTPFS
jgi:hypothetical protein